VADLAVHGYEHRPPGFVGMPAPLAAQLGEHRADHHGEYRGDRLQAAGRRGRRRIETVVAQVLQQPMARPAARVLVQQDGSPHQDSELAAPNQPTRDRTVNRIESKVRSRVEPVFALVMRLIGFAKVRYRGLKKNATRAFLARALANIYLACGRLAG